MCSNGGVGCGVGGIGGDIGVGGEGGGGGEGGDDSDEIVARGPQGIYMHLHASTCNISLGHLHAIFPP